LCYDIKRESGPYLTFSFGNMKQPGVIPAELQYGNNPIDRGSHPKPGKSGYQRYQEERTMPIDLQYLSWLQDIRNATGGIFDEFFNGLSKFAVDLMPFLPFLVFWSLSRKWGYRFMLTHIFGELLNGIIKLTVCAYRPWIRSDKIVPAGDSKTAATGYSFPSGHSLSAGTTYGTAAVATWKKKKWVAVLCILLILLTGFSRNFLGVHTPQDVIVGITEAFVMIFLIGLLMKWMDGNGKRADLMTVAGILFVIGSLLYITLKPYPMDYSENGELLVDPKSMMNDSFKACGMALGLLIGSFVERHYIHFRVPKGAKLLPLMAGVGLGILFGWKNYFAGATVIPLLGKHWGNLLARFIMVFFAVAVWPLVIRRFCGDGTEEADAK